MSGKMMGKVWEMDLPFAEKFVLLAMADHADHEGNHIRPSVELICWKTGYSDRQVRRIVKILRRRGILETTKQHTNRQPAEYRMNVDIAPMLPPREQSRPDNLTGQRGQRGQSDRSRPDELSSQDTVRPDNLTGQRGQRGQSDRSRPDKALSGKPSWNHESITSEVDLESERDRARAQNGRHWAVTEWLGAFPQLQFTTQQEQLIAGAVTNAEAWKLTRQDYMGSPRWKADNVGNVIDRYQRHVKELSNGHDLSPSVAGSGSRRARGERPAVDWDAELRKHLGSATDEE